jgi:hypothetical protein
MPDTAHTTQTRSATTAPSRRTTERGSDGRSPALEDASAEDWLGSNADPDVLLSVPDLTVDKLTLKVKELRADVDLQARVLDLLDLRVGAHVTLGEVDLDIENVRAQAMLKVRLDKVAEMVEQVLRVIAANPELITNAGVALAADARRLAEHGTRTVSRGSQEDAVSGTLGTQGPDAEGFEGDVDAVQSTHRVQHDQKAARKRSSRKSSTPRRRPPET